MFGAQSAEEQRVHDPRVVLGVDPGLTRCGYAVLERHSAQDIKIRSMGVIRTDPHEPLATRLAELQGEIIDLLGQHRPAAVAVEQVYFQTNVRTAMSVGQASGVVIAAAAAFGSHVEQYSPSQVKSCVAGWGGASKDQIGRMIVQRFGLSTIPAPADVADAIAIGLCHCTIAPFMDRRNEAVMAAGKRR